MINYNIVLTDEHLKVVFAGLGELPAKLSYAVIRGIEQQTEKQKMPPETPEVEPLL